MSTVPLATVACPTLADAIDEALAAALAGGSEPCLWCGGAERSSRADIWSGQVVLAVRRAAASSAAWCRGTCARSRGERAARVAPAPARACQRTARAVPERSAAPGAGPAGAGCAGAASPASCASSCSCCSSSSRSGPACASPTPATTPASTPATSMWCRAATRCGASPRTSTAPASTCAAPSARSAGERPAGVGRASRGAPHAAVPGRVAPRLPAPRGGPRAGRAADHEPYRRGRPVLRPACGILARAGTWRSLVAHLLWEQGVGGSNPPVPTSTSQGGSSSVGRASAFQAEGRGFETRLPLHLRSPGRRCRARTFRSRPLYRAPVAQLDRAGDF